MYIVDMLRIYWEERREDKRKNLSADYADEFRLEEETREEKNLSADEGRLQKIDGRKNGIDNIGWLEDERRGDGYEERLIEKICRHKVAWQILDGWDYLWLENTIDKQNLKNICRKTLTKNLTFVAEMHRLDKIASKHNIDIIFYKGAALATDIYGNVGARSFNDIDVLVNGSGNAKILKNILIEKGYQWIDNLSSVQEKSFLELHCEYMLLDPRTNILVEIHWKLFYKYLTCEFDMKQVFGRARNITICSKSFKTLGLVDNFITLAMHHHKHQWCEFRYICDIAGLMTKLDEDAYNKIIKQAKKMRVLRVVLVAFQLSTLMGMNFPDTICDKIASDRHVLPIAKKIRIDLLCGYNYKHPYLDELISLIHVKETWSDRIRYILGGLFSPSMNDYRYIDLPEKMFFLYYLIRPFRQFIKIFKVSKTNK